jgi:RNA polymerase sigma-70 factor (ECF subfamily)
MAVVMRDSDSLLLQEFLLSGDSAAFASIVEKYHAPVYRLAYKFTHDSEDAQDVTQDTFVRAYEWLLKNTQREIILKPWLMTICVNLCRNLAKKKKTFNFSDLESEEEADSFVERVESRGLSPRDEALKEETGVIVQNAVQRLPKKYQVVVELRYTQDLSYEEIADILKIPLNTVKVHLNRAKKTLKSYLTTL